jgi:hypothetical protein
MVHDQAVFTFSGDAAESLDSLQLNLEAGYHPFTAYYLRRAPTIAFRSQMKGADGKMQAVPQELLFYEATPPVESTEPAAQSFAAGIQYTYYEGQWKQLPDLNTLEPLEQGLIDNISLLPRKKEAGYAFRYEGYFNAPADGLYQFFVRSADGAQLYMADSLLVDNDGLHTFREASGSMYLKQGKHPFRLEFFNSQGGGALSAEVQLEGFQRRAISSVELFHDALDPQISSLGSMIKTSFSDVVLFPNPSQGDIVLEFNAPENRANLQVFDAMGYPVYQQEALTSGSKIHLSHLKAGMYIVSVSAAGEQKKFKLMLQ